MRDKYDVLGQRAKAASCGHVDRGDSFCVDNVLRKIQSSTNRREKQLEPSSEKFYEDEQMLKLCIPFAKVKLNMMFS
jgi:hypothetical protein